MRRRKWQSSHLSTAVTRKALFVRECEPRAIWLRITFHVQFLNLKDYNFNISKDLFV